MKNKNIKYDKISLGHFDTVKPRKKKPTKSISFITLSRFRHAQPYFHKIEIIISSKVYLWLLFKIFFI
jgi:hypothetical protein